MNYLFLLSLLLEKKISDCIITSLFQSDFKTGFDFLVEINSGFINGLNPLVIVIFFLVLIIIGLLILLFYRRQNHTFLLLKKIIDSLNHPFYVINANTFDVELANTASTDINSSNEGCALLTGMEKEECKSEGCPLVQVINTKKPIQLERSYNYNGKMVFQEVRGFPVIGKNGTVKKIIEYRLDITQRKKNEEQINKLSQAVIFSPASVVITDKQGNIEYVNPKFTEVTGYTYDEVKGENPRILKSGYQNQDFYKQMWKTILSGKDWRGEFHNKKKNREIYWESASISPLKNKEGEITHFIAVKEDITKRKKQEEDIERYTQQLKELNATKDKFFSIIAHDLKNPFSGLMGFSQLLVNKYPKMPQEKVARFHKMIHDLARQGYSLLENLLVWSRSQTGRLKLEQQNNNISKTIFENVEFLQPQAARKEIQIEKNAPENLQAYFDDNMITTVLRNLITNAIKFTGSGGKIIVQAQTNDQDSILVSVKDDGIGISQDVQEKLFRIDENVSSQGTDNEKGTGLGLILCKEFISKHGGDIWVESEKGLGTTFYFTLPAKNEIKKQLNSEKTNQHGTTT